MNKKPYLERSWKKLVVKPTTFGNNLVVDEILTTTLKLCVTLCDGVTVNTHAHHAGNKKVVLVVVLVVGSKGLYYCEETT